MRQKEKRVATIINFVKSVTNDKINHLVGCYVLMRVMLGVGVLVGLVV